MGADRKKDSGAAVEERRFTILRRLFNLCDIAATFNEVGYLCGPETIKRLAANGYISVEIKIKPKGIAAYKQGLLLRRKRERRAQVKALAEAA